ncbi:MAG: Uncharacterised protein [Halieaceae bacterium]|nr:MAG: Uncharacterised protein [Halieaceae bacterium]
MTSLRCDCGISQPCRTRTNDSNRLRRRRRFIAQHSLVTCSRINQTRRRLHAKRVIETRLITGNARINLIATAGGCFVHKLAVSQHGASHRHQVSIASLQNLLSDFWHVDAVGSDQRNADFFSNTRSDTCKGSSGHHGGNGWDVSLVPNKVRRNNASTGLLELLRQECDLVPAHTTFKHVHCGNAENNNKIVAHGSANTSDHLERKAHSILVATTPLIGSLISLLNQKCGE